LCLSGRIRIEFSAVILAELETEDHQSPEKQKKAY